ncbi:MAG: isoprenyl transferase [Ignavibacteriales bacterium]|nr:isoprenyl transferase [Ignavibacteriales bacterium]
MDLALEKAAGHDKKLQERLLQTGQIPTHVAIIMDGNGRWAQKRGLPRIAGHHEGVNSVRDIVEACGQLGVKYLTLYAFSTENWKRPEDEVSLLMRLLLKALKDEKDRLHQNEVQLKAIGEIATLPQDVQDELLDGIEVMKRNTGLTLILALSYSGRWDITNAVKRMYDDIQAGMLKQEDISEKIIASYLSTKDYPDPDLLIRTSGELRISNFLLWQLAYSELFISQEYWPAFRRKDLYAAIADYQRRERRFGMVSEQVQKNQGGRAAYVERFLKSVAKL